MDRTDFNSSGYRLESQIRDAYGRVVYSQTCHDNLIHRLLKIDEHLRTAQIVLSGMTTTGFIVAIFSNEKVASVLGAVVALIAFILSMYSKNANLVERAAAHKKASDALWKIREEYVSLLIDFELLDLQNIISIRDKLQSQTHSVYSTSPRTDKKSYKYAQKALKYNEEQTFSDHEIDIMLPTAVRRCNRCIKNKPTEDQK